MGAMGLGFRKLGCVEAPDLLQRIAASPFQYFRFTNLGFAAAICATFEDILPALPTVNLHGDAHLEQFAVTDARGSGPPSTA